MATTPKTDLVLFDPKSVATYGNQMLAIIVAHETAKESAETILAAESEKEKVINFDLTRVAMHLHIEGKVDLYQIYQESKDSSSSLYRAFLVQIGVLVRKVNEKTDAITYDWTDKALAGKFDFPEELKEKNEKEYLARRSRRNSLNIRLARVIKAAITLIESKTTPEHMLITTSETGEVQAMITKGPKELMGKSAQVQIVSQNAPPVEGATMTPTLGSLAKAADKKHKPAASSKQATETTDKNANATSADFNAIINTAMMAVKAKEGTITADEKRLLVNLVNEIAPLLK